MDARSAIITCPLLLRRIIFFFFSCRQARCSSLARFFASISAITRAFSATLASYCSLSFLNVLNTASSCALRFSFLPRRFVPAAAFPSPLLTSTSPAIEPPSSSSTPSASLPMCSSPSPSSTCCSSSVAAAFLLLRVPPSSLLRLFLLTNRRGSSS
eukprot:TRINITY_DN6166_c0_g1_i2.p2 TRINITY_DN6166_c0_g1~~TRINITY_DN6166_c0_g1_i2.p2  ORF type:complete len:156 (-),score=22.39 TRINITY_DN6166_c0_g1_i2:169-636(-)